MFGKSNVNKTVYFFLVSSKYSEIIMVKTVTLYTKKNFFSLKVLKVKKEAGTKFVLLCQSRNMVGQFKIDQSRFYIFSHPREFKNI